MAQTSSAQEMLGSNEAQMLGLNTYFLIRLCINFRGTPIFINQWVVDGGRHGSIPTGEVLDLTHVETCDSPSGPWPNFRVFPASTIRVFPVFKSNSLNLLGPWPIRSHLRSDPVSGIDLRIQTGPRFHGGSSCSIKTTFLVYRNCFCFPLPCSECQ